jgi:cytochrome c biogenesis protein CcmG/thiol:disulfide interchange protein DsbE
MQAKDPPETADGGEDEEFERLEAKSRRLLIVALLVIVTVVAASTWFVGGTQGFEQLGQGGVNASLLPKVGEPAPDVSINIIDLQGRQLGRVRLSDFRGHPVWLNFWGSWCPPCRAEMPDIQAAYAEELGPRGLVWLAVSLNEPAEDAADFAALNNVTFTIASDPNRLDTGSAYPIANFPTHILIDEEGVVRDIVLAAIDKEEIIKRAEKILPDSE